MWNALKTQTLKCIICYSSLVVFCNSNTQTRPNFIQYNKHNNNVEKTCECKPFYYCKNIWGRND